MKLLQIDYIKQESIKTLRNSFNNLPHTDHKDGEFRLRRFSRVELRTSFWNAGVEIEISRLPHADFTQSEEFNDYQGGMARSFEEIEDEALFSRGMKDALLIYKESNNLNDGIRVDIHQLRVITAEDVTQVSPEGIHQDGYNHISMLGVNRHNITGGELLLHKTKESEPVVRWCLEDGEMVSLDDSKMWHNANPIKPVDGSKLGGMDLLVFCANHDSK